MGVPHVAVALLVEVHAHDERLAERLHGLDELRPGGVMPQDVTDDDLALHGLGFGDDLLGLGDGHGEGFSTKTWQPASSAATAYSAWVSG
jgi:hypothetical protein